jgi:hypothetical protein
MKCREFKKYLGEYVDGDLSDPLKVDFQSHLQLCESCRKSYEAVAGAWEVMNTLPPMEPSPAFVSRFWTKVARQGERKRSLAQVYSNIFLKKRWVPVILVLGVLLFFSFTSVLREGLFSSSPEQLSSADMELIQNFELAEHFDDINEIEELQDADLIEELDKIQV